MFQKVELPIGSPCRASFQQLAQPGDRLFASLAASAQSWQVGVVSWRLAAGLEGTDGPRDFPRDASSGV
jgi:hypothetical protein